MKCETVRVLLGVVRGQIVESCVAGLGCEGLSYQDSGSKWDCLNGGWLYKAL